MNIQKNKLLAVVLAASAQLTFGAASTYNVNIYAGPNKKHIMAVDRNALSKWSETLKYAIQNEDDYIFDGKNIHLEHIEPEICRTLCTCISKPKELAQKIESKNAYELYKLFLTARYLDAPAAKGCIVGTIYAKYRNKPEAFAKELSKNKVHNNDIQEFIRTVFPELAFAKSNLLYNMIFGKKKSTDTKLTPKEASQFLTYAPDMLSVAFENDTPEQKTLFQKIAALTGSKRHLTNYLKNLSSDDLHWVLKKANYLDMPTIIDASAKIAADDKAYTQKLALEIEEMIKKNINFQGVMEHLHFHLGYDEIKLPSLSEGEGLIQLDYNQEAGILILATQKRTYVYDQGKLHKLGSHEDCNLPIHSNYNAHYNQTVVIRGRNLWVYNHKTNDAIYKKIDLPKRPEKYQTINTCQLSKKQLMISCRLGKVYIYNYKNQALHEITDQNKQSFLDPQHIHYFPTKNTVFILGDDGEAYYKYDTTTGNAEKYTIKEVQGDQQDTNQTDPFRDYSFKKMYKHKDKLYATSESCIYQYNFATHKFNAIEWDLPEGASISYCYSYYDPINSMIALFCELEYESRGSDEDDHDDECENAIYFYDINNKQMHQAATDNTDLLEFCNDCYIPYEHYALICSNTFHSYSGLTFGLYGFREKKFITITTQFKEEYSPKLLPKITYDEKKQRIIIPVSCKGVYAYDIKNDNLEELFKCTGKTAIMLAAAYTPKDNLITCFTNKGVYSHSPTKDATETTRQEMPTPKNPSQHTYFKYAQYNDGLISSTSSPFGIFDRKALERYHSLAAVAITNAGDRVYIPKALNLHSYHMSLNALKLLRKAAETSWRNGKPYVIANEMEKIAYDDELPEFLKIPKLFLIK